MDISASHWDPTNAVCWSRLLGMVHVPMFAAGSAPSSVEESAILLDGPRASFAFMRTEDSEFAETTSPLSWSWSSHVRHTVAVLPNSELMYVRRWDQPQVIRRFRIPCEGMGAVSLLEDLEAAALPRRPDVVRHILAPFRQIRLRIGGKEPLWAVRLLNALLLLAEEARLDASRRSDARGITTFRDVSACLSKTHRCLCALDDLPQRAGDAKAKDLVLGLLEPDPYTGCELYPTLLFRHAASALYQEAHLEIERSPDAYLPGMEPVEEPSAVSSPRDVRFTPANLARALVQRAIATFGETHRALTILDPACGSGVFLVEAIRELSLSAYSGMAPIKVVGYDISDISEYTTRFCVEYAANNPDSARPIQREVVRCDSLARGWAPSDIILMNPPFIPWGRMTHYQREQVLAELGGTARQRPDIAMAFVKKAVRSLRPGGVLATVLPAALLSGRSGLVWRERLGDEGSLKLLGCFEGYRYFPTSLVETAFLIYRKKPDAVAGQGQVEVLISDEGSEDAAIRALRLRPDDALYVRGAERFTCPEEVFSRESWRPLRQKAYAQKQHIRSLGYPRVKDLFEVKQGARLGHSVFLLRQDQYRELSRKERSHFRPAGGGGSIRDGQLAKTEYVFYPYATDGSALIHNERELQSQAPTYYAKHLKLVKHELAGRRGFENHWWDIDRKRSWQLSCAPKLVSTYFGESGSFAFDDAGEYITVNGHAWLWRRTEAHGSALSGDVPFTQTPAVWAYLALLNSRAFGHILSFYSVRLQGGQMRLEPRFLADVPLPDLADREHVPARAVDELVDIGKAIHAGQLREVAEVLDRSINGLYGL